MAVELPRADVAQSPRPRRRLLLVYNPAAGADRRERLSSVRQALEARGAVISEASAGTPEAARESVATAARAGSIDAAIAAGGDGTIRQVAAGVAGTDVPVGIIPLGTGNVMSREIGLPHKPSALAEVLLNGSTAAIKGGLVNGEPFYLWTGVGLDGRIIAALDQRLKRRLGRLAYGGALAKGLAARPDELHVTIDGVRQAAAWVLVSNARLYGGSFRVTDRTSLAAPGLVALVFRPAGRLALAGCLAALAAGALPRLTARGRLASAIPCRRVHIESAIPAAVQVDGDRFGPSPITIDANGPTMRLIVPRAATP